jgi:hypothetical protein
MGCLPVPEALSQLAHGAMLLKRCALPMHATVDVCVRCRWRDVRALNVP